jgi:hypothetical protein
VDHTKVPHAAAAAAAAQGRLHVEAACCLHCILHAPVAVEAAAATSFASAAAAAGFGCCPGGAQAADCWLLILEQEAAVAAVRFSQVLAMSPWGNPYRMLRHSQSTSQQDTLQDKQPQGRIHTPS